MTRAIICDLDGTLASCGWRTHFVSAAKGERKDWKSFFGGIWADAIVPEVNEHLVQARLEGWKIILVSGRPDTYRAATEKWLEDHEVAWDRLLMRPAGDFREDSLVKSEIYLRDVRPYYEIQFVLDDRKGVIAMWKRMGLVVFEVVDPCLEPEGSP